MSDAIFMNDIVKISMQYQRSIRLDADFGKKSSVEGFIFHETANSVITNMANQILNHRQCAFTFTGPYGGGKSSLALALMSSISKNEEIRDEIRLKIKPELLQLINLAFPIRGDGWDIVPVVGKKSDFIQEIIYSLNDFLALEEKIDEDISPSKLIAKLLEISIKNDGLIIFIDEMGKFLEGALSSNNDIHFFQDLAEAASRSNGRLIIIGILHQSFRQYASKYGQDIIEEWSKVQGRYSDLPVIVGNDEIVELMSNAISCDYYPKDNSIFDIVSNEICKNRPALDDDFVDSLKKCWPLHPVMSALLSSVSRKQYSQNERSIFTFLSSGETYAFQDFLKNTKISDSVSYRPHLFWDYIRGNLENTISSSSDAHKWAQAIEAVERAESRSGSENDFHANLVKNIAIINIFKNGTGLVSNKEILESIFKEDVGFSFDDVISDLEKWKIVVFRKYLNSWSIFDGSDFDIDEAIKSEIKGIEQLDSKELVKNLDLSPVIAKRHYYMTGALRRMDIVIANEREFEKELLRDDMSSDCFGKFILLYDVTTPHSGLIKKLKKNNIVLSFASESSNLLSLGKEFIALNRIKEHDGGLDSDAVARKEVLGRLNAIKNAIEIAISNTLQQSKWVSQDLIFQTNNLSAIASDVADRIYSETPVIKSEIINRIKLSSSAAKARRELMHKLVLNSAQDKLGIEGYPAERGLYEIILKWNKLHICDSNGNWVISEPSIDSAPALYRLWKTTDKLLNSGMVSVKSIYNEWSSAPFGVQTGILPVIFVVYFLSRNNVLSLYKDNFLLTEFSDVDADELLQNANRFSVRKVVLGNSETNFLKSIKDVIENISDTPLTNESPLAIARALVRIVYTLPGWTRTTKTLSRDTTVVRDRLLEASDPYKILFVDLKEYLCTDDEYDIYLSKLEQCLDELINAYPSMLLIFKKHILNEIGSASSYSEAFSSLLHKITDYKFRGFLARINDVIVKQQSVDAILSILSGKSLSKLDDNDVDSAYLISTEWITRFKHLEAYTQVDERSSQTNVIALVTGVGNNTETRLHRFLISKNESDDADKIAKDILEKAKESGINITSLLAAITKLSIQVSEGDAS